MSHDARLPKTRDEAGEALTGSPVTLGYRPGAARSLALYGDIDNGRFPAWRVAHDVEKMLLHPDVAQPYGYYKAGIANAVFEAEAATKEQARFAHDILARCWELYLDQLQLQYDYGWCGYEVAYEEDSSGRLDLSGLTDLHPLDCWALTTTRGAYWGVRLRPSALSSGQSSVGGDLDLWGPGRWPARGLWLTHNRRWDRFYGRTQLYGAWRPWVRLATRDGAEDILDGGIYRAAYRGPEVYYPPEDFRGPSGEEDFDAARRVAQQMGEELKSGSSVALPSNRRPDGSLRWEVKWTESVLNFDPLLSYEANLQKQISRGVGVPPELLEASEVGSGWAGRKIPLLGFYTGQLKNARGLVRAILDQIVRPLLKWNFGDDAWCEAKVKLPLPEELAGDGPESAAAGGEVPQQSPGAEPAQGQAEPAEPDAPDGLADLLGGGEMSTEAQAKANPASPPQGPPRKPPTYTLSAAVPPDSPDPEKVLDQIIGSARTLTREARSALLSALAGAPREQALPIARRWADEWAPQFAGLLADARLAAALDGMAALASGLESDAEPLESAWKPDSELPLVTAAAQRLSGMRLLAAPDFAAAEQASRRSADAAADEHVTSVVEKVREALGRSVEGGGTLDDFRADIRESFGDGVLTPAHAETLFRTNVLAAYSDGQEKLLGEPGVGELFPYAAYHATRDDRVRPEHREMETRGIQGTNIYRRDDPVWQMFRPPWGHNCRCAWTPVSVAEAARRGIDEAKVWLQTGVEPAAKAFVEMPDFRPDREFAGRGVELSAAGGPDLAGELVGLIERCAR